MDTNDIDKKIEQNLNTSPPGMEIDVRLETMAQIEAYERKKAKKRNLFLWILSVFTFCAGLLSIYIFEGAFLLYEDFFLRIGLDLITVKVVFQGIFLVFVLISLTVMISQVKPARRSYFLLLT
jgi:hypothetical protein